MMLLDTDHISIMQHAGSRAAEALDERLNLAPDQDIGTTAITLEEQSRSWLDLIRRYTDVRQQVTYYEKFAAAFRFFAEWRVIGFDLAAAERFRELRSARIRIPTSDLKIASVCLVNDATLLSRNLADFTQVPGLRVENWLET
jgi:tRNA(fMet)-specific endonuclease VapC